MEVLSGWCIPRVSAHSDKGNGIYPSGLLQAAGLGGTGGAFTAEAVAGSFDAFPYWGGG
jgi:hypothetical protein